tara:strand:+ start:982 stop:1476 length:495 start_codon:yes stop_codon:yes gene_type:complete
MKKLQWMALCSYILLNVANANTINTLVYSTDGKKTTLGQVSFKDTPHGLLITPNLNNLPSGLHGFHIHQSANCGDHGNDAGGHFDPKKTNSHEGPYGEGHLGDLPALYVNNSGQGNLPTLAPRLKTTDLKNVALMIHEGGDTYTNTPKLGGGGARIGCGVIKNQ